VGRPRSQGIGVVMRREIGHNQPMEIGQSVTVSVVDPELEEEGHALLSMRRAVKDRGWDELQRVFDEQEIVEILPYDANRGGLLVELEAYVAFYLSHNSQPQTIQEFLVLIVTKYCKSFTPWLITPSEFVFST